MSTFICVLLMVMLHVNGEEIYCDITKEEDICACDPILSGQPCYLNCMRKDACKDGTIRCRPGDACVIDCTAEDACAGNTKIIGSGATEVTVLCGDETSCKGNTQIYCGLGHCHIVCAQYDSCEDAVIFFNTASSFECSPMSYCQEAGLVSSSTFNISPDAPSDEAVSTSSEVTSNNDESTDTSAIDVGENVGDNTDSTEANDDIDNDTDHDSDIDDIDAIDTDTDVDTDTAETNNDSNLQSFDATPDTQPYAKTVAKHDNGTSKSNTVVVPEVVLAIISFVAIGGAVIGGCCYWKKLRYQRALKQAMIEYGSLSSF